MKQQLVHKEYIDQIQNLMDNEKGMLVEAINIPEMYTQYYSYEEQTGKDDAY